MIANLLRRIWHYERLLRLKKRWAKLRHDDSEANPHFTLTRDVLGVKNRYPMRCRFCEEPMLIRYTCLDWSEELGGLNTHIDVAFKCPSCDWFCVFGVPVPAKYFLWLLDYRERVGVGLRYAPRDMWLENPEAAKRLESWGYF